MGTKANAVTESVLSALLQEVGPHRFAIALNNVCCHGTVFAEGKVEVSLDDEDKKLNAWFDGITDLIEVGKWLEGGKEPKPKTAPVEIDSANRWCITTADFEKLIFDTIGVTLAVKDEPAEAEHRFSVLTREKFVEDISDLLITGKKLCDLCIYIYRQTEMETVRGHSGNMLIRNAANLDTNKAGGK
jgi:hypothetical protein